MKTRKIPTIRLDKTNVDSPTINRALDNIISNVNTFMGETVQAIDDITIQQNPVNVVGGAGIAVVESPTNTFTITNTGVSPIQNLQAGTGIAVNNLGGGTYEITNTLPEDTNILAGSNVSVVESPAGTFTISATGGTGTNSVGSGIDSGFGVRLYTNGGIAAEAPTTGVPANTKQYSVDPSILNGTLTATIPAGNVYTSVTGFLTDTDYPSLRGIQPGVWNHNFYISADSTTPTQVKVRVLLYKLSIAGVLTLIHTSDEVNLSGQSTITRYAIPMTYAEYGAFTPSQYADSDRLYIALEAANSDAASKTVTFYYGGSTPSHTTTTIASMWKLFNSTATGFNITADPSRPFGTRFSLGTQVQVGGNIVRIQAGAFPPPQDTITTTETQMVGLNTANSINLITEPLFPFDNWYVSTGITGKWQIVMNGRCRVSAVVGTNYGIILRAWCIDAGVPRLWGAVQIGKDDGSALAVGNYLNFNGVFTSPDVTWAPTPTNYGYFTYQLLNNVAGNSVTIDWADQGTGAAARPISQLTFMVSRWGRYPN